jgi:hypothetical protein
MLSPAFPMLHLLNSFASGMMMQLQTYSYGRTHLLLVGCCALAAGALWPVQLVSALQDAKTSSVSAIGMVDMAYVGSYLRSKHGYFILLRTANIAKRPRSYLRMLRHSYLVCRGIEGVGGELRCVLAVPHCVSGRLQQKCESYSTSLLSICHKLKQLQKLSWRRLTCYLSVLWHALLSASIVLH